MNKFSKFLILFVAIFFGGGGIILAIFSVISPANFQLIESWLNSPPVSKVLDHYFAPSLIGICVVVSFSAFLPMISSALEKSKRRKLLKTVGQPGLAKIISITNTGIVVNNSNYFLKIVLEVPGGSHAEIGTLVNVISIPRVGSNIKIIYDPSNPQIILPEWDM
jgi:hypothetical protein